MSSPYEPEQGQQRPGPGDQPQYRPDQPPEQPDQPPYQPYQPGYHQQQYQPGYQEQPYQQWGYQGGGQQYQYGYPPAGGQWSAPAERPRRPGVLVAAGVLWLLNGAFLLVVGVLTALADRLPGFDEAMRDREVDVTRDQLVAVGVSGAVLGAAMVGLGIVVFGGATWARILIMVVAIVPTAFLLVTIVFPLFTIAASTLQWLPPVSRYVQAKRRHAAIP